VALAQVVLPVRLVYPVGIIPPTVYAHLFTDAIESWELTASSSNTPVAELSLREGFKQ
jgi:hypothetical protein